MGTPGPATEAAENRRLHAGALGPDATAHRIFISLQIALHSPGWER